jgi:4-carboxymuconolactone decarboxylase
MAEDEALSQKGMPIRREVLGPEYVDASMARADEFMMSFQRATTAWAWAGRGATRCSTEKPAA